MIDLGQVGEKLHLSKRDEDTKLPVRVLDSDRELGYSIAKAAAVTGVGVAVASAVHVTGGLAALFLLPGIGATVAEVIGTKIPNVRMKRVEEMVSLLYERIGVDGAEVFNEKVNREDFRNLFEQAVEQASKSKSKVRIEKIANLLASSLTIDGSELFHMTILDVIDSLSDIELTVFYIVVSAEFQFARGAKKFSISESAISSTVYNKMDKSTGRIPDQYEVDDLVRFATTSLQSKGLIKNLAKAVEGHADAAEDGEWNPSAMGWTIVELTGGV